MLHFTTNACFRPPTLITLQEPAFGQVSMMAESPCGEACRIATLIHGKLHIFRFSPSLADELGMVLETSGYPVIVLS